MEGGIHYIISAIKHVINFSKKNWGRIFPSWKEPPEICLLWKNGRSAPGARSSALGWDSLLWALGKIEWSNGRTSLGWSFLWAVGAWNWEEVVWLILGFHSCVLLLKVFSYRTPLEISDSQSFVTNPKTINK